MREQQVDHLRTLYSSGLYHISEIYIKFAKDLKNQEHLMGIIDFTAFPKIREDLESIIQCVQPLQEVATIYHKKLQILLGIAGSIEESEGHQVEIGDEIRNLELEVVTELKKLSGGNKLPFSLGDVKRRLFNEHPNVKFDVARYTEGVLKRLL